MKMKRLSIFAALLASFVLGMATPAFTFPDYPNMRSARGHLVQAKEWLEKSYNIRNGRREKALDHVNKAIDECDLAIADR